MTSYGQHASSPEREKLSQRL